MPGRGNAVASGSALESAVADVGQGLGLTIRRQVRVARRLWGAERHIDIVMALPDSDKSLGIECKYQGGGGSAEEKIPAIIQDIIALGMACCQHDYRVRFLTAAELTTLLVEAQQQGRLARKLDQLARFDVVIVDELGYVPFDKAGADLLFGFISRRYERGSLVVTTNLPFARWSEVFLDATAAAAVIDRIVHHATVLTTNGDSYRLKAAQRNQTAHARQKKTR